MRAFPLASKTSPADTPTVAIETQGCKLNQADSSVLGWRFAEAGFRVVSPGESADVHVLNTCTVTHIADRKARQALRALRRRNPDATIVATGCYPQRSPQDLEAMQEIDLVVGNTGKDTLVRQVLEWRGQAPVPCAVGAESDAFSPRVARTRAMVKIQEGCDQVCAYCVVPRVRGRERSIPPQRIIDEINGYFDRGYNEVVLTGTQLGSYGFDLPEMTLARLLARVLSETNVPRVRVSSLQPQEIGPQLLELWEDTRLCPHFHLPLQSGSDRVLSRMRRRYTGALYTETVGVVRQNVPDVSITADVIVGFPGETDEEFQQTYDLCRRTGFAGVHVFPYSVRPGTGATHLDGRVTPEVKTTRMQAMLDLSKDQAAGFRTRFLGKVRPVLWEEVRENGGPGLWSGLTDNYIRVLGHSHTPLTGRITPARLSTLQDGSVYAQVIGSPTTRTRG